MMWGDWVFFWSLMFFFFFLGFFVLDGSCFHPGVFCFVLWVSFFVLRVFFRPRCFFLGPCEILVNLGRILVPCDFLACLRCGEIQSSPSCVSGIPAAFAAFAATYATARTFLSSSTKSHNGKKSNGPK